MMKPTHPHTVHLPRVTFPRWGWRVFVVGVALLGCLPAVVVRFQILATLDEFDAKRVRHGQQARDLYAEVAQRHREEQSRSREFDSGVLR